VIIAGGVEHGGNLPISPKLQRLPKNKSGRRRLVRFSVKLVKRSKKK
jgi:hypothetical protein